MTSGAPDRYLTLAEWAADGADMRIVCKCGRKVNFPADRLIARFGSSGAVSAALLRLRCTGCRRRGHAGVSAVLPIRR